MACSASRTNIELYVDGKIDNFVVLYAPLAGKGFLVLLFDESVKLLMTSLQINISSLTSGN